MSDERNADGTFSDGLNRAIPSWEQQRAGVASWDTPESALGKVRHQEFEDSEKLRKHIESLPPEVYFAHYGKTPSLPWGKMVFVALIISLVAGTQYIYQSQKIEPPAQSHVFPTWLRDGHRSTKGIREMLIGRVSSLYAPGTRVGDLFTNCDEKHCVQTSLAAFAKLKSKALRPDEYENAICTKFIGGNSLPVIPRWSFSLSTGECAIANYSDLVEHADVANRSLLLIPGGIFGALLFLWILLLQSKKSPSAASPRKPGGRLGGV